MAYPTAFTKRIEPNHPRDFLYTYNGNDTSLALDVVQEYHALGLDLAIQNLGSSSLTISIDGRPAITIGGNKSLSITNVKFARIKIVNSSGVDFNLAVAGVTL